jgi:hypothetical protein
VKNTWLLVAFLLSVLLLGGCAAGDLRSATVEHFYLGENYGRAGLVLTVCSEDGRPPDSVQIRANLADTAVWAEKQGITFDQPRAYIDAPDLVGVDEWGTPISGRAGWRDVHDGCLERVVEGAFNNIREWDVAGACPVSSYSLRLNWGRRRLEIERPCTTPVPIVFPSEQLPPGGAVGSEQWAVNSGQWAVGSEQWTGNSGLDSDEWRVIGKSGVLD